MKGVSKEELGSLVEKALYESFSAMRTMPLSVADFMYLLYSEAEAQSISVEPVDRSDKSQAERAAAYRLNLQNALKAATAALLDEGVDCVEIAKGLSADMTAARIVNAGTEEPPLFNGGVDLWRESLKTVDGLPSGWSALDDSEIGVSFNVGELAIIAARTGHGKTSALVNLLWHWASIRSNGTILFYSHEEPPVRIYHRLLSLASADRHRNYGVTEIRDYLSNGAEADNEQDSLSPEKKTVENLGNRIQIIYRPRWTAAQIASHARRVDRLRGVDAVIVDYLQRLPEGGSYDRRDIAVSASARDLKALAVDVACPVVAGAQINREAAKATVGLSPANGESYTSYLPELRRGRPELHHLREGGSEQEADLVIGLHHLSADYPWPEGAIRPFETIMDVLVLKNRYGASRSVVELLFDGKCGRMMGRD